ncbi:MAG: hypothetical protein CMA63_01390 [Euryarchaeota archaeon]|nr:hypothetical protein [Euryarchaeota archaeon]|tara:strand:- start:1718 stop:2122 length:405 start_codon:yes stop_codon:yes gene_type:complete
MVEWPTREGEPMAWKNALKSKRLKPGKSKMVTIGLNTFMVGQLDDTYFATEGLCRHMRWPLAWGGKIKDGCIRCPLHQTTHHLSDGSLVEWSPFPLIPAYGKLLGKLSKPKDLKIFETRVEGDYIQIQLDEIKS